MANLSQVSQVSPLIYAPTTQSLPDFPKNNVKLKIESGGSIQIGETTIQVNILELYLKELLKDSHSKYPEYYI